MKFVLLSVLFGSVFLIQSNAVAQPIETGWKGIEVFQSTRAGVEKTLGKPVFDSNSGDSVYPTSEGNIVIAFSGAPCSDPTSHRSGFNLDEGTVIEYTVYLKKPFPLKDLQWEKNDYARTKSTHYSNTYHYTNTAGSVWVTTRSDDDAELVQSIWFMSTVEQRKRFRCKTSSVEVDPT